MKLDGSSSSFHNVLLAFLCTLHLCDSLSHLHKCASIVQLLQQMETFIENTSLSIYLLLNKCILKFCVRFVRIRQAPDVNSVG